MEDTVVNGKKKRDLRTIICYKNREGITLGDDKNDKRVVIVRRDDGDDKEVQRSVSGKAEYDMKTGEIILTDKPVLVDGINEIHGTKITIWRDSEVMDVQNGRIQLIDQKL